VHPGTEEQENTALLFGFICDKIMKVTLIIIVLDEM